MYGFSAKSTIAPLNIPSIINKIDYVCMYLMIVFVFSQFSEDKKKRYEEIRKRVTNDLLSMPSEAASQEVATPSTSGDAEKPKKSKEEIEAEEREKMQVLVSHFTEDQLDRYEMYRRAAFPKAAIKRIMQTITGCSVGHNVVCGQDFFLKFRHSEKATKIWPIYC